MDPDLNKLYRKQNRKNLTPAEATLWKLLKGKQFHGRKFRRQHPFGNYFVDFYCVSEKLVIELDGPIHSLPKQIEHDNKRDEYLKSLGLTILRFKNKVVFEQRDFMLQTIMDNFKKTLTAD